MLTKGRSNFGWHLKLPTCFLKDKFPQIKVASPKVAHIDLYHFIHVSNSHLLDKLQTSAKVHPIQRLRNNKYVITLQLFLPLLIIQV